MPQHPEDQSLEWKFLQFHLEFTREAYRTAEALLRESADRLDITERDARQHLLSFAPMVADGVLSRYFQMAGMFHTSKTRELEDTADLHTKLLAEIKTFNADMLKGNGRSPD